MKILILASSFAAALAGCATVQPDAAPPAGSSRVEQPKIAAPAYKWAPPSCKKDANGDYRYHVDVTVSHAGFQIDSGYGSNSALIDLKNCRLPPNAGASPTTVHIHWHLNQKPGSQDSGWAFSSGGVAIKDDNSRVFDKNYPDDGQGGQNDAEGFHHHVRDLNSDANSSASKIHQYTITVINTDGTSWSVDPGIQNGY